ncbi:tRNA nuclease WapA precursor [compost metagenome]
METDADGNPLAYYVYGLGLLGREDASGAYQTYHYDRRGSTVALTALDGTITDTYEYGPYGEQIGHEGATEQPFRYNGRDGVMTDANGLYHMRARYYSPDIKRFINRDVVTGTISDTPTLNRYAYVNGNPISYIDPFGLSRDGDSLMLRGGDVLLDLVPGVGALKGFQQAFTGVNLVTGEKLSVGQRWMEGIGSTIGLIPIPGSKAIGKYGVEGAVALGKKAKGWFGKAPDPSPTKLRYKLELQLFGSDGNDVKRLSDDALVVRGGQSSPDNLKTNQSNDPRGHISCNVGCNSLEELANAGVGFKNGQLSVTTVGEIRKLGDGWDVILDPTKNNPLHGSIIPPGGNTLNNAQAENLSNIFEKVKNIWKVK